MASTQATAGRELPSNRIVDVDFYNLAQASTDFHQAWKDLQDQTAPFGIVWTPRNGGHWIATRGEVIQQIVADSARFSSHRMTIPPGEDRSARWDVLPISLDPPEHEPYRRLLNTGLSPKVVNGHAQQIRTYARELISRLAARGSCEFVADYAEDLPLRMLFMIMNLPFADKARMLRIVNALTTPDGSMTVDQIVGAFSEYLRPFIQERRAHPGTDLISAICTGRVDDRPISEQESVQMCVQTFAAGLESVRNALSFMMLKLAQDPQLRRDLLADPTRIAKAKNEFLRRYSAMILAREVVTDFEYDGVQMRRGDLVACPTQLVALDERQNPCPMQFDLGRKRPVSLTFGGGVHFCAGRWLAEAEIKITLEEWLLRIPEFRVAPAAPVRFTSGILGAVVALPLVW